MEPAEPVEELAAPAEELPPLQKRYRGAQRSPQEADTSHGLLQCYQL